MYTKEQLDKALEKAEVTWCCRFHPTNWWHEVGCPHKEWTNEELRDALVAKKKFDTARLGLEYPNMFGPPHCEEIPTKTESS